MVGVLLSEASKHAVLFLEKASFSNLSAFVRDRIAPVLADPTEALQIVRRAVAPQHVQEAYSQFSWETAWLRDIEYPILAVLVYLVSVLVLSLVCPPSQKDGKSCRRTWLTPWAACHNLFLSAASLVMVVGTAYELYRRYTHTKTIEWFFCENQNTPSRGPLLFWSYVYYLSKFYELGDTILTLLRGSRPPSFFLHVYHHSVVVFMAWLWLEAVQTLHWAGLLFNGFVHVVMYYYYYLKCYDVEPPWKNYITGLQILQFMTSLFMFLVFLYVSWHREVSCKGTSALYFNLLFNVTLLFQFVGVFKKNTKPKSS